MTASMQSPRACLHRYIFGALLLLASPASADTLRLGVSVSSKDAATQSFLRFFNTGGTDNTVDVALTDLTTGAVLSTWTSPAVPAGTAAQYAISTIEKAAAAPFNKPAFYVVTATPRFSGFAQSVLYKPSDGTLSNISGCDSGLAGPGTAIPYVHSSLLSSGFPSHLVISNTGTAAVAVTLGVYNETTGAKLGTYTTAPIAKSAALFVEVSDIEAQAKIKPAAGMYHYIVKVESPLTGFVQHLVENIQAGLYTDITSQCTLTATTSVASRAFGGNVVLGSPTSTSIRANVYAPDQTGTIYIAYGKISGTYDNFTPQSALAQASPVEVALDNLSANTRYYYRLYFRSTADSAFTPLDEYSFQTARPAGTSFTFAVQGDSHPERERLMFNANLYVRTLNTAAADKPDFYIMLGDDFSVDTLSPATINQSQVTGRYTLQRPWLGLIGRTAPVFLVNGNHEQAAKYLLDGTANNIAVWAQNARNSLYSQPAPDTFYSGNTEQVPFIGLLRNYYAWTWGDALFVTIDPYWSSPVAVDNTFGGDTKRANLWDITHGDAQYQWLKRTLEQSKAKYKFVFAHHVMGTQRGGVEVATQYEWGGNNGNGSSGFAANRPTWPATIHQLFVDNHVTIFFQGHDHIWATQSLDGVIYQTLPVPADPNYALLNADAYRSGDKYPGSGYARVSVSPAAIKVDYVRTYLPADEGPSKTSGGIAYSYSVP